MTLYYLKDQGSCRMTANIFGTAKFTHSKILSEVVQEIINIPVPKYIKLSVLLES